MLHCEEAYIFKALMSSCSSTFCFITNYPQNLVTYNNSHCCISDSLTSGIWAGQFFCSSWYQVKSLSTLVWRVKDSFIHVPGALREIARRWDSAGVINRNALSSMMVFSSHIGFPQSKCPKITKRSCFWPSPRSHLAYLLPRSIGYKQVIRPAQI